MWRVFVCLHFRAIVGIFLMLEISLKTKIQMINFIDFRRNKSAVDRVARRSREDRRLVEAQVGKIVRDVKARGDRAVREYTEQFDGVRIRSFTVKETEAKRAVKNMPRELKRALREAAQNIRRFHSRQLRKSWSMSDGTGSRLGLQLKPIERVGVYIPGGKAAYPSSVLMAVIPAQVAGVPEVHLVSPPDGNGRMNRTVLAAASLLGVTAMYSVGGPQAVAALAYGTQSIPKVDKIVGPGNLYVQTAKRIVFGDVGIDSFAGPSEIVVVADETANAAYVAADLLAQAEHDENAMCLLISTSERLINDVRRELSRQIKDNPRKRIIKRALKTHGALILVKRLVDAIDLANLIAPEHLELHTRKDRHLLKEIRNAGAIFLGEHTPVAVGDYFAGPNHVLPTAGSARFSSPLGVDDFLKASSVIEYSQKRLAEVREHVAELATCEGLDAHRASVAVRFPS
jgi:histidinol dehydrogenase